MSVSMHSVEDYDPSASSKPIFGGNVSQTKIQEQQQITNNLTGKEKLTTPPQPVTNGQNDTTNNKSSDNLGNGTTESVRENPNGTEDTTDVHVNGDKPADALPSVNGTTKDNVNPAEESVSASGAPDPIERSSQNEPSDNVTSTDPAVVKESESVASAPALSVSEDVAKEDAASAPATNPDNAAPPPPGPPTDVTSETATTSNESLPASVTAPEATVLAQSATPERKGKSPRVSKAKSPIVSTPPTRQSTRAKKPTSASSAIDDENEATEDPDPSPKRVKRQAATVSQDVDQATSTTGSSSTKEVIDPIDQDVTASDVNNDADVIEDKTKRKTPSPRKGGRTSTGAGRKRAASSSPSVSPAKKTKASPKGDKSATSTNDEQQMDVDTTGEVNDPAAPSETEPVQTPTKKPRTSGNRTTPTATTPESSGDYVRKLRPRK